MARELPESITVGLVRRPHGVRGELKVKPLTDFPQRFHDLKSVYLNFPGGGGRCFQISQVRAQNKDIILRLAGVDSREDAGALSGSEITIPLDQVRSLPEDRFYHFEVIGFEVTTIAGRKIGEVREVMDLPANAVFIVTDAEKEYLIPCIKDVIRKIDKDEKNIIIDPIDGLLE